MRPEPCSGCALDDRTLEYRFEQPAPYFLVQASNWSAIPLRQALIEQGGPDWWKNPATRIGNGPYRLAEYKTDGPDRRLVYARNEHYWGGPTKLDEIAFLFFDPGDPAAAAYRQEETNALYDSPETWPQFQQWFWFAQPDPEAGSQVAL